MEGNLLPKNNASMLVPVLNDEEKSYVDQYRLECGDEDLSEVQSSNYAMNNEMLEFARTLQATIQSSAVFKQIDPAARSATPTVTISSQAVSTSSQFIIPTQNQNGFQNGGYVVVDPSVKLVVSPSTSTLVGNAGQSVPRATVRLPTTPVHLQSPGAIIQGPRMTPRVRGPAVAKVAKTIGPQNSTFQIPLSYAGNVNSSIRPRGVSPINVTAPRLTSVARQSNPETDGSSVVDLTDDESRMDVFLQEEEPQLVVGAGSSAKKGGPPERTYPSLVVTARTSLSNKTFTQAIMNAERQLLDNRLKRVLQLSPAVFTEHLLQQRLIKCEQTCTDHPGTKLKLGMYSDAAKFPYSGGYVWIADCCGGSFTTVFRGSIFEIGPHAPTVILKLLYHWSCQTSVANILQWVKVDNNFLKTFFMYLRAACVAAVHEKSELMGGPGCKKIEVGVISLGTSTGAGAVKEVKVDILGAMDYENKKLRLRALDHLNMNDPSIKASDIYLKKFQRILETLRKWVDPNSVIVTDFAIDRNLCNRYGFKNMTQCYSTELNNSHVMEYLRFVVPRMFQNTLNLLSRHIIQQFLDELVWRESWGQIPSRAYDRILEHLAEQTKLDGPEDMSVKYTLISSNPYKDWKYSNWAVNMSQANVLKKKLPQPGLITNVGTNKKKILSTPMSHPRPTTGTVAEPELAQIALEPYYYGTIQGDPSRQKATGLFGAFLTECVLCGKDLYSSSAFTNHLVHHALNDSHALQTPLSNSLKLMCRFCMRPMANMEAHVKDFHKHSHLTKKTMCKVCNSIHRDVQALINHMICTHVELDMPYFCEICQYRTSVYQDMLVHFEKFHNKDTCVQCPCCLKVVRFSSRNGEDIPRNQLYFIQHVQKHIVPRNIRKCEKCALSFTNLATLRNHQEYFHSSCAEFENVERYDYNPNDFILMAAPLVDPPLPLSLNDKDSFFLKGIPLAPSIRVHPSLKLFLCAECDGPITQNHFCVRMTCTKCTYQTCCANAIKEHNASAHPTIVERQARAIILGGRPIMSKALYCGSCLFSSANGNKMATHLALCDDGLAIAVPDRRRASMMSGDSLVEELAPRKRKKIS